MLDAYTDAFVKDLFAQGNPKGATELLKSLGVTQYEWNLQGRDNMPWYDQFVDFGLDQLGGYIQDQLGGGGNSQTNNALPVASPNPSPQLPAVIARGAATAVAAGVRLAPLMKTIWRMLLAGMAIDAVTNWIVTTYQTSQPVATELIARAIKTRGGHRRMNPCNPRALKRAITRIQRFDKFADATEKVLRKYARRK